MKGIEMTCNCGSGEKSFWVNDARNIPLAKVCRVCKEEKLSKFRPEVITNPNYETCEPIEPEDYY
jgi:hypothetical protein